MPSNRVVTYIDMRLNSVEQYWSDMVAPDARKFRSEPSPNTLFHAATAVWHLHDWVWHERNPGVDSRGTAFNTYRADLLAACPELGWLRDIADASKHRGLGRLPEVQGAEPQMVGGQSFLLLGIPTGEVLKFFLVFNDGAKEGADQVLDKAIDYWRADLNLPSPFE